MQLNKLHTDDGADNSEPETTKRTGQPNPKAKATEPHDPDPHPRNERDGATSDGQAPNGNATNTPRDPATD